MSRPDLENAWGAFMDAVGGHPGGEAMEDVPPPEEPIRDGRLEGPLLSRADEHPSILYYLVPPTEYDRRRRRDRYGEVRSRESRRRHRSRRATLAWFYYLRRNLGRSIDLGGPRDVWIEGDWP